MFKWPQAGVPAHIPPAYCQYDSHYCGAVSVQMIMNSYRGSYQGTVQDQKDIYEWIEKHTEQNLLQTKYLVRVVMLYTP